ncbi:AAA family ATPase [Aureisphaera galaxeae]|uniref:AAA family ATPase n=1 Tax=Aureisphaera galaxeae TaxID=1538023 RepID=UPI00235048EA|nr:AAA family ATPase [Aureisphaera galaxeae]MDC8005380.1 AAA family ATPase [Aureisphaera galaxeae]
MRQKRSKIYFTKLTIENFRCFGKKQTLNFSQKQNREEACRWNVILGDNGVGKTSILRALALSMLDPMDFRYHRFIPWNSFRRSNSKRSPEVGFNAVLNNGSRTEVDFEIQLSSSGFEVMHKPENLNAIPPNFYEDLVLYAYGAARRIGSKSMTNESEFPAISLFQEDEELTNVEEWLVRADYHSLKKDGAKKTRNLIFRALRKIMRNEITSIKIELLDNRTAVLFKTAYGWVPLHELSLGYKTFLAWMVDFAKGLIERYPESKDPLSEPAVCLIDEIDLHLHPKLQRDVVSFLLETFKGTQFIATAHSPLIAQTINDGNLILVKKKGNQVVVDNNPESVQNWRIDQILTSDLFGLSSGHSQNTEELLKERKRILGSRTISPHDEVKLRQIGESLGDVPVWETQVEKDAYSAVDKIAEILEKKGENDPNPQIS